MDPEHAYTALLELEARGLAVAAAARRLRGQVRRSWVAREDTERELATLRAEIRAWEGDVALWRRLLRRAWRRWFS